MRKILSLFTVISVAIVMVEQNFRFAAPLADRFLVMEHGEVIQEFTQAELPERMERLHEYLGV